MIDFHVLKQWWNADTGGWPTLIVALSIIAFLSIVGLS